MSCSGSFLVEHVVDIDLDNLDNLPCVFRVPKSLTQTKPEAYAPQKLGLGPFHHRNPDLYTMQWKKLAIATKFLKRYVGQDIERMAEQRFEPRESLIRASYDVHIDLDRSTLAQVVTIDSLYLLSYFQERTNPGMKKRLAADILMLENQIPGNFLLEIQDSVRNCKDDNDRLSGNILSFCQEESPLELIGKPLSGPKKESAMELFMKPINEVDKRELAMELFMKRLNEVEESTQLLIMNQLKETEEESAAMEMIMKQLNVTEEDQAPLLDFIKKPLNGTEEESESPLALESIETTKESSPLELMRQGHLLSVMYNLILPRRESEGEIQIASMRKVLDHAPLANLAQMAEIAAGIGIPGATILQKEISIMEKVPWHEILDKLKKHDPDHKENSSVDEIDIPTVSNLTRHAGITFAPTEKGIRDVRFEPGEKKFYLPKISLRSNSEVILRNLLAYEAASVKPGSPLELAEYVDLMCGIIDSPEDVKILRKAKIIKGHRPNEEIASIFNGILRSTGAKDKDKRGDKDEDEDEAEKTNIERAIEEVNKLYGNIPRVKATRFVKKYFSMSWKFVGVFAGAMVLLLLALQAFCQIYDCRSHWSLKSKYNPLQDF